MSVFGIHALVKNIFTAFAGATGASTLPAVGKAPAGSGGAGHVNLDSYSHPVVLDEPRSSKFSPPQIGGSAPLTALKGWANDLSSSPAAQLMEHMSVATGPIQLAVNYFKNNATHGFSSLTPSGTRLGGYLETPSGPTFLPGGSGVPRLSRTEEYLLEPEAMQPAVTGRPAQNVVGQRQEGFVPVSARPSDLIHLSSGKRFTDFWNPDELKRAQASGETLERFMDSADWDSLHPQTGEPLFHSPDHSETVAEVHEQVISKWEETRGSRVDPTLLVFSKQIAATHDLHPGRLAGTPPRVPDTIEILEKDFAGAQKLLDKGETSLTRDVLGWNELDLHLTKAHHLRSDFPFDATRQAAYEASLRELRARVPDEKLTQVMHHAAILSEVSDKGSTYFTKPFDQAWEATLGLANEIGGGMTPAQLQPDKFLRSLLNPDYSADSAIAQRLGLEFTPPRLVDLITSEQLLQLQRNIKAYKEKINSGR